jgi:predicted methyltransferase
MRVGTKQKLILFALGEYYRESNKRLKNKSLEIVIPKYVFIDLITKLKITEKKPRAIYKNLEKLEKKKLITYKNRSMRLTEKGKKLFNTLSKEVNPYLRILKTLEKTNTFKYTKKAQTIFSTKKH